MWKGIKFLFGIMSMAAVSAGYAAPANYVSANTYNNMYPYMNNRMRTALNPGTNPIQNNAQINVLARTKTTPATTTRRVVSRPTAARAASTNTSAGAARATTTNTAARATTTNTNTSRRVVARPRANGNTTTARAATRTGTTASRGVRSDNSQLARNASNTAQLTERDTITSTRCLADYTECMNGYCMRENTEYNRCYCSARLAQIDAQYRPTIDNLVYQIIALRGTNSWSNDEMNEYWDEIVGTHTGDNSWKNLDAALDIDWSSTESRVRGQQAFADGHAYCAQHLRGCAYMASNMRDVYRSEIARDCATYEASLQSLQNAAESVVEAYK